MPVTKAVIPFRLRALGITDVPSKVSSGDRERFFIGINACCNIAKLMWPTPHAASR